MARKKAGAPIRRGLAALVLVGLLAAVAGCGEGEGVAAGAKVHAYVGAALCPAAQRQLAQSGGKAGDVEIGVLCLAPAEGGKRTQGARLDLATVGANARRATQDSTTVAYFEAPGPANRFARTIVEEAGIAWDKTGSGAEAVSQLIAAVEGAGSGSLREAVRKALG